MRLRGPAKPINAPLESGLCAQLAHADACIDSRLNSAEIVGLMGYPWRPARPEISFLE
jgi:hypothetical protein